MIYNSNTVGLHLDIFSSPTTMNSTFKCSCLTAKRLESLKTTLAQAITLIETTDVEPQNNEMLDSARAVFDPSGELAERPAKTRPRSRSPVAAVSVSDGVHVTTDKDAGESVRLFMPKEEEESEEEIDELADEQPSIPEPKEARSIDKRSEWFFNIATDLMDLQSQRPAMSDTVRDMWERTILYWTVFESVKGFCNEHTKLPTKKRPADIGVWIKGRRKGGGPTLATPAKFGVQWRAWWYELNPPWRRSDNGTLLKSGNGPWGDLASHGPCGVGLALLTLGWWCPTKEHEMTNDWLPAVRDVCWVLWEMMNNEDTVRDSHSKKRCRRSRTRTRSSKRARA
ncbi:hypothetical protein AcV5_009212 [Taiwanofungus camphoratus]|nr:hypothetical protein AcV5_009212 [Antrodia cinnamomea]